MADNLNGRTFYSNAAIGGILATFTRNENDTTTDYTNSVITLAIYTQNAQGVPTNPTVPTLTLSVGAGLTRVVNTASAQSVQLVISEAQVGTLLGATTARRCGYAWSITPTGLAEIRGPQGSGYQGFFIVAAEGYAGVKNIVLP